MITKGQRAQTAVELAVFGSILIFVLGSIIRLAVNTGLAQHSVLRATRMAMTASYRTSTGSANAARNFASVLIVEDRLSADSAKYGAVNRVPFMAQGSGAHTTNLFMPVSFKKWDFLPRTDMYINGKRFVFMGSIFKDAWLAHSCSGFPGPGSCPAECVDGLLGGLPDCEVGSLYFYPATVDTPTGPKKMDWEPNCVEVTETKEEETGLLCRDASLCPADPDCPMNCVATVMGPYGLEPNPNTYTIPASTTTVNVGCAKLHRMVFRHKAIDDWCDGVGVPCPVDDPADDRFNLDRWDADHPNGLDGIDGIETVTIPEEREGFIWQWKRVMGFDETRSASVTTGGWITVVTAPGTFMRTWTGPVTTITSRLLTGEGIVYESAECRHANCRDSKNVGDLDVDMDLKPEDVVQNTRDVKARSVSRNRIILRLGVVDSQDGDLNTSVDDSDEMIGIPPVGFDQSTKTYTLVNDAGDYGGTYLAIDEGDLFDDGGQFIRTASKKDKIDIIERVFQLSNHTGRFCNDDPSFGPVGQPTNWASAACGGVNPLVRLECKEGIFNPVEVCVTIHGECRNSANVELTCMNTTTKRLFMRSRLRDLHGHKWVTDLGDDPHVDFTVPSVP